MELTWDRVLAWRLRRQFLADRDGPDAVAVTRRVAGVQAQVPGPRGREQAQHGRGLVMRCAAGWIAPVVLDGGRVVGTWSVEDGAVVGFDAPLDPAALDAERAVWSRVLGRELTGPG